MKATKNRQIGVTLIELMITVVIVAILAAIAYPSYNNHVTRTRRSDAQSALMRIAALQEKFYADCGFYAKRITGGNRKCIPDGGKETSLEVSNTSAEGYYTLAIADGNISGACSGAGASINCGFTATATPVATKAQAGSGNLRIDATGTKQWDKGNAGTYSASWTDR